MHVRDLATASTPLSAELHRLAERFRAAPVAIREVIEVIGDRAYTLLLVILALPFCVPMTIPGLSTPIGAIITLIALRYALGLPPWLPARLLRVQLPPRFFGALAEAASRILRFLERALHPRLLAFTANGRLLRVHAAMICLCGLLLAVPAPIPLTNTLPALAIVFGAAGTMERDGWAVLAGYFFAVLSIAYFALIATVGAKAFDVVLGWLGLS